MGIRPILVFYLNLVLLFIDICSKFASGREGRLELGLFWSKGKSCCCCLMFDFLSKCIEISITLWYQKHFISGRAIFHQDFLKYKFDKSEMHLNREHLILVSKL